ncbi:hypothetical protein I3760_01G176400 [Carya illinoinensis]|nr:hypothetical protein I3760_01G176400 [Carya illinoinensis]
MMVIGCIPNILKHTKWKIKLGEVFFWHDKWLEEGPLSEQFNTVSNSTLKLKDLLVEDSWDFDRIGRLVGPLADWLEVIKRSLRGNKWGADVLIWLPNPNEKFSTKSAWEVARLRMPRVLWVEWVWHPCLPKFMAIYMWKGLNNALSVDDRIRKVGLPIVSRCNCCIHGAYEDLSHVLAEGEFARLIWRKCASQIGMSMRGGSWREIIEGWLNREKKSSKMGNLMGLLPSIITWRLWTRRCKERMDGIEESAEVVWRSIKHWVAKMGEKLKAENIATRRDEIILKELGIPSQVGNRKKMQIVRWCPPLAERYKINSDGSSRGNPGATGAGGVI